MWALPRHWRGRNEHTYGASSWSGWCPHRRLMWDWCQMWPVKPKPHLAFNLEGDWWTWRRFCGRVQLLSRLPPPPFTESVLFGSPSLVLASQDDSKLLQNSSSLCTCSSACNVSISITGDVVFAKAFHPLGSKTGHIIYSTYMCRIQEQTAYFKGIQAQFLCYVKLNEHKKSLQGW